MKAIGLITVTILSLFLAHVVRANDAGLSLREATAIAVANDPWLTGSRYREDALGSDARSLGTLPDPKVTLQAANLPVDTFDFNQEPMTQLKVGVSQMFPRGDSLDLSSRQKRQLAEQEPLLREDRIAKVRAVVSQLWLDAYEAQESIRLIENDRALFEHLLDATKAGYASAIGQARQQDVIRSQLELTRLEDRLTMLRQQLETAQRGLVEWIDYAAMQPLSDFPEASEAGTAAELARIKALDVDDNRAALHSLLSQHPVLRAFDRRIESMQTGVALAEQKYKPEWGFSAQYGYRDDDPMGRSRADFFSIGVSFDVPLFTGERQDQEVSASISRVETLRTEKILASRKLLSDLETSSAQFDLLTERLKLYESILLPQMAEQADAALVAYNNDDGDFAEAIRARIAELNAKIHFLGIKTDRQKALARLAYLITPAESVSVEGSHE